MESKTNRMIRVTALAAALSLTALQLSAQQGTFNLPVEAHWGNVVLAPGEHNVSIPGAPSGVKIVYLRSDKDTQMTLPVTSEPLPARPGRSFVRLVKVNGTYYVDAYQSEMSATKYFFARPKSNRTAGPAAEESTIINVSN